MQLSIYNGAPNIYFWVFGRTVKHPLFGRTVFGAPQKITGPLNFAIMPTFIAGRQRHHDQPVRAALRGPACARASHLRGAQLLLRGLRGRRCEGLVRGLGLVGVIGRRCPNMTKGPNRHEHYLPGDRVKV
jgi:hypothetical protein